MLPAYFANMAPVIFKNNFRILDIPVDLDRTWRGRPLLGRTKTIRGFVMGIVLAVAVTVVQKYLFEFDLFKNISLINYQTVNFLILGLLFGLGALAGDAIESFFKRQLGVKPSESLKIWDQIDFVLGALVIVWFYYDLDPADYLIILGLSLGLTILTNHASYYLRIRKEKW